jgi:hypothetical protein
VCEFYFVPEYCSCYGNITAHIGCQWKYYCLYRKPVFARILESVFFCSTTLFYGGVYKCQPLASQLAWLGFAKNISHHITELVFIYSAVSV